MMKTESSHALTAVSAMLLVQKQKSSTITKQTKKRAKIFFKKKNNSKNQHRMHRHCWREAAATCSHFCRKASFQAAAGRNNPKTHVTEAKKATLLCHVQARARLLLTCLANCFGLDTPSASGTQLKHHRTQHQLNTPNTEDGHWIFLLSLYHKLQ